MLVFGHINLSTRLRIYGVRVRVVRGALDDGVVAERHALADNNVGRERDPRPHDRLRANHDAGRNRATLADGGRRIDLSRRVQAWGCSAAFRLQLRPCDVLVST